MNLIAAIRDLPKVCEALHLPVQSGSDNILASMNRKYTRQGLPGQSGTAEAGSSRHRPDHGHHRRVSGRDRTGFRNDRCSCSKKCGMTGSLPSNIPKDRELRALKLSGHMRRTIKEKRFADVLDLQKTITDEKNRQLVGTVQEVLVDGISKKGGMLTGRTRGNKTVNVEASASLIGSLVHVTITAAGIEFSHRHPMRIAFTTLGCKINQYETDHLRQDLQAQGNTIVPFEDAGGCLRHQYLLRDGQKRLSVQAGHQSCSRRGGNGARVVVTGCYASTRPDEVAGYRASNWVVGNRKNRTIPLRIMQQDVQERMRFCLNFRLKILSGRTRGFLKIQDGCDNRCSYCIVPLARGSSRSVRPGAVIREFEGLVQDGCPEIVLTGIHIGTYGSDLSSAYSLTDLVRVLLQRQGKT